MFRQADSFLNGHFEDRRKGTVVAGPGSAHTIPGVIVSEIVRALSKYSPVTRIEVDVDANYMTGLHRALSLATVHEADDEDTVVRHRAPDNPRLRSRAFQALIQPDTAVAIAYAWPGIDNDWIRQFLQIANARGAFTIVACASLPNSGKNKVSALAEVVSRADRVYIGEIADATILASIFGSLGPVVEAHPALSLRGRAGRSGDRHITAFLPKDSKDTLATLLAAFDAIPEAWIPDYRLHVVMRYSEDSILDLVEDSYHSDYVRVTGGDLSLSDLENVISTSSALGVAEPAPDSRAFSSAVNTGIATVVLSPSPLVTVGRGYVGGLLADSRRPASVHVALNHALRLEELRFPSPRAWDRLAQRLSPVGRERVASHLLEPVTND